MKNKKVYIKHYNFDESLKVGDKIKLTDGTSLSIDNYSDEVYIIYAYQNLTGKREILKNLTGTIIKTRIKNTFNDKYVNITDKNVWMQDLQIKIGKAVFKVASGHVKKI